MTTEQLKNYLMNEAEYTCSQVDEMDDYERFDAYLKYNGIIGYTSAILDAIAACPELVEFLVNKLTNEED